MIRLALAEDHTIVRWAIREALSAAEDIEVVGEAGTAAETIAMLDAVMLLTTLPEEGRSITSIRNAGGRWTCTVRCPPGAGRKTAGTARAAAVDAMARAATKERRDLRKGGPPEDMREQAALWAASGHLCGEGAEVP